MPSRNGASYFHRATPAEAFQRTFFANNRVSRAVQRYIRDYATRVGLPHKTLLPAFRTFSEARATTPRSAADLPRA